MAEEVVGRLADFPVGTHRVVEVAGREIVACPWHGLEYHVPTGRCLAFPEISLRTYPVWVDGDEVVVSTKRGRPAA
jgi:nitrite reductase/ring-hydroxylating ferredoxin subunit